MPLYDRRTVSRAADLLEKAADELYWGCLYNYGKAPGIARRAHIHRHNRTAAVGGTRYTWRSTARWLRKQLEDR